MRTIEKTVYNFNELSDEVKQKALEKWSIDETYFWASDALNSLKKFADYFGSSLENWSIDFLEPYRNSVSFSNVYDDSEETISELLENAGSYDPKTLRGLGDCKLTGYCADEDLLDGFRKAWFSGERDVKECLLAGLSEWESVVKKDCEYQFSIEGFAEHCEANGYEFDEDGNLI